jgi:phage terminase small subunit
MPRHKTGLSPRGAAFVRLYLAGPDGVRGNATRAYLVAGYAPRNARTNAFRLKQNPHIAAEIPAPRRS